MKEKILVVEDSALVSFHLASVLKRAGYNVLETLKSGEEALEFVQKQEPDLILMDIMLDGHLDGIETAGIIGEVYDIPIIYLTALSDKDTIERAKHTFPASFLIKPFEEGELLSNIQMALYRAKSEKMLKRSEERFSRVIEAMNSGFLLLDENFLISMINASGEEYLKVSREKLITTHFFENFELEDQNGGAQNQLILQALQKGDSFVAEGLHFLTTDQYKIPVTEFFASPLYKEQKGQKEFFIIFSDGQLFLSDLRQKEKQSREKLSDMIAGQEMERNRISRELHDGLGQLLNAIKINLSNTEVDEQHKKMLIQHLNEAIDETKRISEDLLPSKLMDFDLVTCVKSLVEQYNSAACELAFHYDHDFGEIPDYFKINIYRIIQEAIHNTLKHASANKVQIQLYKEGENISLSIEDNGKGFDLKSVQELSQPHHGINNMRDRTEIMHGQFELDTFPGKGTSIIIQIPITVYYDNQHTFGR